MLCTASIGVPSQGVNKMFLRVFPEWQIGTEHLGDIVDHGVIHTNAFPSSMPFVPCGFTHWRVWCQRIWSCTLGHSQIHRHGRRHISNPHLLCKLEREAGKICSRLENRSDGLPRFCHARKGASSRQIQVQIIFLVKLRSESKRIAPKRTQNRTSVLGASNVLHKAFVSLHSSNPERHERSPLFSWCTGKKVSRSTQSVSTHG
jgi:hypothetical protein